MFVFQGKLTLALKVAELSGILAQKDAEIARLQANLDWLMAHVNEMKLERAEILERALGIQIPVPEIVRQPVSVALPGADANYRPSPIAEPPLPNIAKPPSGDLMQRARDMRDQLAHAQNPARVMQQAVDSGLFEDMGDEAAKEAGIVHGPSGEVLYPSDVR